MSKSHNVRIYEVSAQQYMDSQRKITMYQVDSTVSPAARNCRAVQGANCFADLLHMAHQHSSRITVVRL